MTQTSLRERSGKNGVMEFMKISPLTGILRDFRLRRKSRQLLLRLLPAGFADERHKRHFCEIFLAKIVGAFTYHPH